MKSYIDLMDVFVNQLGIDSKQALDYEEQISQIVSTYSIFKLDILDKLQRKIRIQTFTGLSCLVTLQSKTISLSVEPN